MRILGLDPGLVHTGWGIIDSEGSRLRHIADGCINPPTGLPMAARLAFLDEALGRLIAEWQPDCAAVEETFVNTNAASTLKLGQARGIALLAPARAGLAVAEYATNLVKKSVVGAGHAEKSQVAMMIGVLLNIRHQGSSDAADALAVAICHAHHYTSLKPVTPAKAGVHAHGLHKPQHPLDSGLRRNDDLLPEKNHVR